MKTLNFGPLTYGENTDAVFEVISHFDTDVIKSFLEMGADPNFNAGQLPLFIFFDGFEALLDDIHELDSEDQIEYIMIMKNLFLIVSRIRDVFEVRTFTLF